MSLDVAQPAAGHRDDAGAGSVGTGRRRGASEPPASRLWVERVTLTDFRNYASASLETGPEPVILVGDNGAGKTNLLEAVSLLGAGQGLRRAAYADLVRSGGTGGWAVAAQVHTTSGAFAIGTGLQPGASAGGGAPAGRIVRIDGATQPGSGALADLVEVVWVTPAMDGLFTGPATDRRRFLDRLVLCFDPEHARRAGRFERAMQSRNRLLADGVRDNARLEGFEIALAEAGVAIAAARAEAAHALAATVAARRAREAGPAFPWAHLELDGTLEAALAREPALDVEDGYRRTLRVMRERDRAAGRTLEGPHRSDLIVGHGPKGMPARLSSTGEQKALLLGLVLAHAELVAARRAGAAPLLLLDEVAAHLDETRRAGLFAEILALGCQAWMTGTDRAAFTALDGQARTFQVHDGRATLLE